jgi:hypothetical protein
MNENLIQELDKLKAELQSPLVSSSTRHSGMVEETERSLKYFITNRINLGRLGDTTKIYKLIEGEDYYSKKPAAHIIKIKAFNSLSLRCHILFSDHKNQAEDTINYGDIKEVEEVPVSDLPLYISLGYTSERGQQLLSGERKKRRPDGARQDALAYMTRNTWRKVDSKIVELLKKFELGVTYKIEAYDYHWKQSGRDYRWGEAIIKPVKFNKGSLKSELLYFKMEGKSSDYNSRDKISLSQAKCLEYGNLDKLEKVNESYFSGWTKVKEES